MPLPQTFRSLRHRDFRWFLGGQVISLCGTWMQSLAQSWLVYRLTQSTLMMGTLGFCSQIPVLLLGPAAGLAADRFARRRIVITAQTLFMIQALLLGGLTLTNRINVPLLIALALVFGVINAFDIPARQSLFIHMVGKDDLQNAIALNSLTFNAARIVGPSIAGFLVAFLGEGLCFIINGLSFTAVIASLAFMSPAEPRREPTPALQHLREGMQYVWTHLPVRSMLFAVAFANLASTPATVLAPVFADRLFHQGSQGLGFMTGSLGLGAVIGTLALAHITDPARLTAIAFWSGIATGAALIVFAVSPVFPLTLAAAAALGFNIFRQLAAINTLIQSKIDDHYRGRVMSLYSMTVVGMLPIGSLIAGAMAQWLGVRLTVGLGALLSFIAAVIWYRQFPLRKSA